MSCLLGTLGHVAGLLLMGVSDSWFHSWSANCYVMCDLSQIVEGVALILQSTIIQEIFIVMSFSLLSKNNNN